MPRHIYESDVDVAALIAHLEVAKQTPELKRSVENLARAVACYDPSVEVVELFHACEQVARCVRVVRHLLGLTPIEGSILILVQEIYGDSDDVYQPRRPLPMLAEHLSDLKAFASEDRITDRESDRLLSELRDVSSNPRATTAPGDAAAKIVGFLLAHHRYHQEKCGIYKDHDRYHQGKCGIYKAAGVREIARTAEVSPTSVTNFFNKHFDDGGKSGHQKYKNACSDRTRLDNALKILGGDIRPSILWSGLPDDLGKSEDE